MQADSIMEQAYNYYDKSSFNKSIQACQKAMAAYIDQKDSASLSDAYSHLSACYQRMTMNDSALINCFLGLRIDENLKDQERLSSSYNNLAAIYLGLDRPQEAKPFINKAIELETAIKPLRPNKLSIRYGIAAEIYLKDNLADSALYFIGKSLEIDSAAADTLRMGRRLQEGFVVTVHGKGTYVTAADRQLALEARRKSVEDDFASAVSKAAAVGLGREDILEIVEIILEDYPWS